VQNRLAAACFVLNLELRREQLLTVQLRAIATAYLTLVFLVVDPLAASAISLV